MTASLSDDEIEDRYFLRGRMEIISVLNDLIHRREQITVHFNSGRDFFMTTVLEARQDALVFDISGDAKINQRLSQSSGCVFVARLNGIRVQFVVTQPERFSWGGSDAYIVPLPERIVRMQRRESYRITLPVTKPLIVKFYAADGIGLGEFATHNLSVGGLGIAAVGRTALELSEKIARARVLLTKQRSVDCDAVVRHTTVLAERANESHYRIGVAFSDLPSSMGVMIQRYITKTEHERANLDSGV